MEKQKLLTLLLVLAVVLAVGGLLTLVPVSSTRDKSDLGYYALCPFAPYSTLTLLGLAGAAWVMRSYLKTPPRKPAS